MAKELFFIKTNPVIAKINLYNKLCREEASALTFMEDDRKTSLEIIKKKIQDSVENLSKEELQHLFSWFESQYQSNNEEVKNQLFINGLDLFYEIPSGSNILNFQQILSDYEKISEKNLPYILNSENFNQFLIYGIFFTGLLNKEKGEESILSHYLKADHKNLYTLAENQFQSKEFNSDISLHKYFTDLYDLTKFYKGNIIKLDTL